MAATAAHPANGISWLAIADGRVVAATVADSSRAVADALQEWAADPGVTEIVRMPDAAVRMFFRKAWPGRSAALSAIQAAGDQ